MKYKSLAKYYNKTIQKIKKYLEKYIKHCETYLVIEKLYIVALSTRNEDSVEKFSLTQDHPLCDKTDDEESLSSEFSDDEIRDNVFNNNE
jgi:hypothetical protein